MHKRQFLRLLGGGFIAAALAPVAGCDTALPEAALLAWRGPDAQTELRRWILAHAILAPHSHNLQSWLVDLSEANTITLRVDLARLLPQTDPLGRQIIMSQGTFLELLDMAARQRGYRTQITPFPEGEPRGALDQRPSARIQLYADASVKPDPLFAAIFKRHTNRAAYQASAPAANALEQIRASVTGYPVQPGFTSTDQAALLQQQRDIAQAAWRVELQTPHTLLESYRWLRVGPDEIARHRDGLSLNEPLPRALTALGLFDRSRASAPDSTEIKQQIQTFNEKMAATPAFFWLISADNSRKTQLEAGRAYVRAQLAATLNGLSMHPLQQALQEYPEQQQNYRAIHQLLGAQAPGQTVQMWARLGYGPQISPAPRRGVAAIVQNA